MDEIVPFSLNYSLPVRRGQAKLVGAVSLKPVDQVGLKRGNTKVHRLKVRAVEAEHPLVAKHLVRGVLSHRTDGLTDLLAVDIAVNLVVVLDACRKVIDFGSLTVLVVHVPLACEGSYIHIREVFTDLLKIEVYYVRRNEQQLVLVDSMLLFEF